MGALFPQSQPAATVESRKSEHGGAAFRDSGSDGLHVKWRGNNHTETTSIKQTCLIISVIYVAVYGENRLFQTLPVKMVSRTEEDALSDGP